MLEVICLIGCGETVFLKQRNSKFACVFRLFQCFMKRFVKQLQLLRSFVIPKAVIFRSNLVRLCFYCVFVSFASELRNSEAVFPKPVTLAFTG